MVWSPLNDKTYKTKRRCSKSRQRVFGPFVRYKVFINMSVRKEISRIKVLLEDEGSKKPSEKSYLMALKDIRPLIPSLSHKIIHRDNLEHDSETIIKLNKEIFEKVKMGDDEVLDSLWDIAGNHLLRNSINIITFYHK